MLGSLARSRAIVGAAALLTVGAASLVLTSGAGPAVDTVRTAVAVPFVGPLAAAPRPRPLISTDGPLLLPALSATRTTRLSAVHRQMGPAVPPAATPEPVPADVGPGSPVAQVRAVQRLLKRHGAGLRVDGAWGPATSAALRRVQEQAGLPADGRWGPATGARLQR